MSERTAAPRRLQRPEWVNEFRDFIMRGNVVDLAIGIIIGSSFTPESATELRFLDHLECLCIRGPMDRRRLPA